ncbi:phage Gp37/Gp68 family protein [Asticcacaulis sp. ZE23SCel15]|uniref:DUF5131 family protein n=1 Tax=Asticcacaulis sp. ZE23SCel15 TaxID=3059027 RepID=UPI00265E72C6|nr:phage Gp37/Gp68 family protein [Asticcacaulis sp. ZE23SCel15]WKL57276.1 phage Gp37/Gp68 family protein [Asticcacaulis sp. ZE23SCel15]
MADKTHIQWTEATWNPITGCSVVSPGCTNCYAMKLAGTRLKHHPSRAGLTREVNGNHVWTGEVRFNEQWLTQPLTWKKPRMIFVGAHTDLFHPSVPDAWLDQIFAVMALTPHHTYQILTKRPARMRAYFKRRSSGYILALTPELNRANGGRNIIREATNNTPLTNVWLGVSVEDQARADERIPLLLQTPAALHWISAEPLLGPLSLKGYLSTAWEGITSSYVGTDGIERSDMTGNAVPGLKWVVAGGENGPRPSHPEWFRALRNQCAEADVPFFFKQWGSWAPLLDRDRDDPDWRADYSVKYAEITGQQRWLNLKGGTGFHGERFHVMGKVGKSAAGDLLDGVQHHNWPQVSQ